MHEISSVGMGRGADGGSITVAEGLITNFLSEAPCGCRDFLDLIDIVILLRIAKEYWKLRR
jgi:hypothetical protein